MTMTKTGKIFCSGKIEQMIFFGIGIKSASRFCVCGMISITSAESTTLITDRSVSTASCLMNVINCFNTFVNIESFTSNRYSLFTHNILILPTDNATARLLRQRSEVIPATFCWCFTRNTQKISFVSLKHKNEFFYQRTQITCDDEKS